jgi:hypothetical protein
MNGYIYTMYQGADPGHGWIMNDPIFGKCPTLGACVPHIRRAVRVGDFIFSISGRVPGERQFVVGGLKVAEKIDALVAYARFPENRMRRTAAGRIQGNVIVTADGSHHPDDDHARFEKRVENYIVGCDPVFLESPAEYRRGREKTLDTLRRIFRRDGNRVYDIIGRCRRLDEQQVSELMGWLRSIKGTP